MATEAGLADASLQAALARQVTGQQDAMAAAALPDEIPSDRSLFRAMYGGLDASGAVLGGLWLELDWVKKDTWYRVGASSPDQPPALSGATLAYSPKNATLTLLGGADANGQRPEHVWTYDLRAAKWSQRGRLPDLNTMGVAHDPAGGKAYLFSSGQDEAGGVMVHEVDLATGSVSWLITKDLAPAPRAGAAVTYWHRRNSLVLFGGKSGSETLGDIWELPLRTRTWQRLDAGIAVSERAPRSGAAIYGSPGRDSLFVLGGTGAYGRESVAQVAVFAVGRGWTLEDSRAPARVVAGLGAFSTAWMPGETGTTRLDTARLAAPDGGLVQVEVRVEAGGQLDVAVVDARGTVLNSLRNASGTIRLPVLALRGQDLYLAVAPPAGASTEVAVQYSVSMKAASATQAASRNYLVFGGMDAEGSTAAVASGTKLRLLSVGPDGAMQNAGSANAALASDVVVEGGFAYLADAIKGLVVYDIRNPASPVKVAEEQVLGGGWSIAKQGDRVYLASGLFGVNVVDVSDPANPMWIDNYFLCDVVQDVSASGGLVAALTWLDGVALVDAAGGGELVSTFQPESCWNRDAHLAGTVLHVRQYDGDVQQIDVASPRAPKSLDTHSQAGRAVSGRTGDGYLLVSQPLLIGASVQSYRVQDAQ